MILLVLICFECATHQGSSCCVNAVWTRTVSGLNISNEATKDCAAHLYVRKDCHYWSQGNAGFYLSINIRSIEVYMTDLFTGISYVFCRLGMKHIQPLRTYILFLPSSGRTSNGMPYLYIWFIEIQTIKLVCLFRWSH